MVDSRLARIQGSDVPTIGELINEALDGSSVRKLEADSGYLVKYQTFQQLSKSAPDGFPKDTKTIRGMAIALKVPESTIVLAYAKGLGVDVSTESGIAARMPRGADALGIEMQNALISVVRAAVKMNGADHVDQPTSPDSPPAPPGAPSEATEDQEAKRRGSVTRARLKGR